MDDDVENLVLDPFREVLAKGNTALDNAKNAGFQPMQKAAQGLISNCERALKKIEPICQKRLAEYGTSFVNALKAEDEISGFRRQLNDVIWDLDDCVEVDNFDVDVYTKLQPLLRTAALRIADIMLRMRLERPRTEPPTPVASPTRGMSRDVHDVHLHPEQGAGDVVAERERFDSSRDPRLGRGHPVPPEDAPPGPPVDPWGTADPLPEDVSTLGLGDVLQRRLQIPSGEVREAQPQEQQIHHSPADMGDNPWAEARAARARLRAASGAASRSRSPHLQAVADAVPESLSPSTGTRQSLMSLPSPSGGSVDNHPFSSPRYSQASSINSSHSASLPDHRESHGASPPDRRARDSAVSPLTESIPPLFSAQRRRPPSVSSSTTHHAIPISPPPSYDIASSPVMTSTIPRFPEPPGQESPARLFEDGLIPVGPETDQGGQLSRGSTRTQLRQAVIEPDCSIDLYSSFHQFKGFCDGSNEIMRGGLGVKKVKQPGAILSGLKIAARCKHCMYETDWALFEADLHQQSSANYMTSGVGFRLRFLSKSHLPAKRVDDELYACLFCVHAGKTTEEADATVFFSQKQLFSHLARHPRPLPVIPGVTVIDGSEVPPEHQNNYDLQFAAPPVRSLIADKGPEFSNMPTAIATETFRSSNGSIRLPLDRAMVLQFAAGAKIVGISFPLAYNGEWAVGWADNARAVFPMDCARLRRPRESGAIAKMQTDGESSGLTAVARWKRSPKESTKDSEESRELMAAGGHWLKFDKGELITGVSYLYQEHWCWAGHNAKGKWGIFPQAFMEPGSLVDTGGSGAASSSGSIRSKEGSKRGVFNRFAERRRRDSKGGNSSRPVTRKESALPLQSVGETGETTHHPSIY